MMVFNITTDYLLMQPKQPSAQTMISVADTLEPALLAAGRAILALYHQPEHSVSTKADLSPVTDADLASHHLLIDALSRATPDWPVISEEDQVSSPPSAGRYWLLDPLDGTKEFIARTGEFSINLGLVVGDQAVFGLLYGPVDGVLYRGGHGIAAEMKQANGSWKKISSREKPIDGGVLISSRRSAATPEGEVFDRRDHLGSALKFGRLAQGLADTYLRRGPTMEWDTCAGQAILEAAGGSVMALSQEKNQLVDAAPSILTPLRYGKPGFLNPGFIARGR
jgi:3'(2'), 5'-bisphosphate nucleotidase